MAKRTAVIDLGSRSFRLVVFEKTSKFGFSVIKEARASVSMGQNIHKNNGILQKEDFVENISILKQFSHIISSMKIKKVLCVATSIIRNAPNKNEFKNQVFKQTGIKMKVIDGEIEARLGAIAILNLLPIKTFITMDIGGGSTEISLVIDGNIKENISLDMGAVRLRSIFGAKDFDKNKVDDYINNLIDKIPKHFYNYPMVAFGGTARTVAKTILPEGYPIPVIHGFEFEFEDLQRQYSAIMSSNEKELVDLKVSFGRLNDIKMGVSIFFNLAKRLNVSHMITSGVGIREGVFLNDLLRNNNGKFPSNFHIGMRNLEDKFISDEKLLKSQKKHITKLFDTLAPIHNIDNKYKKYLGFALSIFQASAIFNMYKTNEYSSYVLTHSTIYELSHRDKIILSVMMIHSSKKLFKQKDYRFKDKDFPSYKIMYWLCFIHMMIINTIFDSQKDFSFELIQNTLKVSCNNSKLDSLIERQLVSKIEVPEELSIEMIE